MDAMGEHPIEGFHVAIIGSGGAAFAAAINATERGARVTMIEEGTLGGTCVNVGCVPSKLSLRAAQAAHTLRAHPFAGLPHQDVTLERQAFVAQQRHRVEELRRTKYQDILESTPGMTLLRGKARFEDEHTLVVEGEQGTQHLTAARILIATGVSAAVPPVPDLADTPYWTSTEALFSEELPEHLVIIGGSFVACELAQAFRRMGSDVTMVVRSTMLSREDPALGRGLQAAFEAEGIRVLTHAEANRIEHRAGAFRLETAQGDIHGDRLLVATGRVANTDSLNLAAAHVETNALGSIIVDGQMRTNVPHIYAAGDCTTQPRLVYVAAAAGGHAAINMTGGSATLDLSVVPTVVFTDPQVATVGLEEASARDQGLEVESRTLDLEMVPRALANIDTQGFIKLVAEKKSGRLVGAQILAHEGGEIVQTAALAIARKLTVYEIGRMLFPYLTMAEGIKLCALAFTRDVKKLSCCAG